MLEAATLCSSLEQVVLADSGYVVLTGAAGCRLHLFTLNGALVWSASIDAGVSALTLSPCGGVLLCGYDDGALLALTRTRTRTRTRTLTRTLALNFNRAEPSPYM